MEMKIIESTKDELKLEFGNLTLAEILRVYLNKDSNVSFVAWNQEHPTKNPILLVKGKNPKKAVKDSVSAITKELDKVLTDFKKLK